MSVTLVHPCYSEFVLVLKGHVAWFTNTTAITPEGSEEWDMFPARVQWPLQDHLEISEDFVFQK